MPWFLDGHPDHEALSDALALDGDLPPELEIWGYETWAALPPNRLIDITETFALKEKALAAHETAHHALELTAQLGLSRWRSMHAQMGRGYAEAFLALPANEYRELTKQARAAGAS
jgi:LmbE family N-acetylglucosaminyl deacetylase